ncbi:MAG: hypothetical protein OXP66_02550 [Candidatus Tectomicrobia bacterium]|nr:hypothetical protein [Candidatus Tectomicrobia bacterium]
MSIADDLRGATTVIEVLRHVARATWAKAYDGAECPDNRIPAQENMTAWLSKCPVTVRNKVADRMDRVADVLLVAYPLERTQIEWTAGGILRPRPLGCGLEERWSTLWPAAAAAAVFAVSVRRWLLTPPPKKSERVVGALGIYVENMHTLWLIASQHDSALLHPLAPLVDAWQQLAPERGQITDKDVQIMPRSVAMVEPNAPSYYLPRFGPAAHQASDGQLLMGFAVEGERGPTLPANIWTMGLQHVDKRGAVVPLPLRIWIAAVMHVPLAQRQGYHAIELLETDGSPLTLRRFLGWIYPGARQPRPNEYWPRILAARDALHDPRAEVPYADEHGNLWGRQVVRLDTPYMRPGLDDPWPTLVHLPPGDGHGPGYRFDRVQYWMTNNAAAMRALINLGYRWHIEGKRLMPAGGNAAKATHWLQRRNPKLYDRLTDADKLAICFPAGTGRARRDMRLNDAEEVLEKLVKAGDAVVADGRLLPPPAPGME